MSDTDAIPNAPPPAQLQKSPLLAAVLSAFPGMGSIYNGLYLRGVTFFALAFGCIVLAQREEIFGFAVAFVWIVNIVDAYRQATLINYGYATDLGLAELPQNVRPRQGGVWAGAALILIGVFAILERFFPAIDLDFLVDFWPFALVAFGAWLVWSSLRQRRTPDDTDLAPTEID